MKIKNKLLITILVIGIIACNINIKAAIVTKPVSNIWNITSTHAYQLCYDLRNSDSTLGDNNLDPHLILPNDWDGVEILANSVYGKTSGQATFTQGNTQYCSSTPNKSGVFYEQYYNGYSIYEHTSSLYKDYDFDTDSYSEYKLNICKNSGTKYVQPVDSSILSSGTITNSNCVVQIGGTVSFKNTYRKVRVGDCDSYTAFRPAIWNK